MIETTLMYFSKCIYLKINRFWKQLIYTQILFHFIFIYIYIQKHVIIEREREREREREMNYTLNIVQIKDQILSRHAYRVHYNQNALYFMVFFLSTNVAGQ